MKGFGQKNNSKESNKNSNLFENDRLINEAFKLHSKGKISEAKSSYQDLIKNGISDPRVYTNLGVIFQSENDYERAVKFYKKSIILFPNSHEAYSNLSRIFLETGQYDLAETYLIKVIKLKNNSCNLKLENFQILNINVPDHNKFPDPKIKITKTFLNEEDCERNYESSDRKNLEDGNISISPIKIDMHSNSEYHAVEDWSKISL